MPSPRDIDFARIRPHGKPASRPSGFEELASILIRDDIIKWPTGTRFHKFGNPDGGREGRGVLPNGDVWAWQAKYVNSFDSSAASQVKKSFLRTLDTEPALRRYFVTMPIDLPAGDTEKSKSAFTLWEEEKQKWEQIADEQERAVTVEFLGAHELIAALTKSSNAGRVHYWFDERVLTQAQQQERIQDVAAKLGRRYSPQLHVEVDAVQVLDGAGRTSVYISRWQRILADLRSARRWSWRAPEGDEDAFRDALESCETALNTADARIDRIIGQVRTFGELEVPTAEVLAALAALEEVSTLLRHRSRTEGGYYVGDAGSLHSNVHDSLSALGAARSLCASPATAAAVQGELLLTGRAGAGKTHLLCDVAMNRIAAGLPTVMLLGQDFDARNLLVQLPELAELPGNVDEILALLSAAAEASGNRALLVVDAVNESEKPERWSAVVQALRSKSSRHPSVGLVISCRTEFVMPVVGESDLPAAEHFGFEESTEAAVRRFASEYGLDVPTFPVFDPEFSNPLFLRLTCEALTTLGSGRFMLGSAGLTTVCGAFIEAANVRLAAADRCDYDSKTDLVAAAVRQLAALKGRRVTRVIANDICTALLPGRSWSKGLLKGLLDEGVLIEVGTEDVSFGYQRLGDVARAQIIAARTPAAITGWVQSLGTASWVERGVLGALAVLLPEVHGLELIDCFDHSAGIPYDVVDAFMESLSLREPAASGARAEHIVRALLKTPRHQTEAWAQLVRVACIPGHPLNARWLHEYLTSLNLPERDATWSLWLIGALDPDERSPVRTVIEWAWPKSATALARTDGNTSELALLLLGWCTSATDRRVRDSATKALVSLGEHEVDALASALSQLVRVNDPYVVERAVAAACGIALRDEARATRLAVPLAEWVAGGWPRHLLTRDYVRRVFETAGRSGWVGPKGQPPYGASWPIETTARDEIEELTARPDYKYGSIWRSLTGMGDFGRYKIEPAVRNFVTPDRRALQASVEEAVFDRVRDLGWTPELLDEIDRGLSRGRSDGPVERIGKKYQWIGFYEVLGAVSDQLEVDDRWSTSSPHAYSYAEQLIWRDIDVTVLVREPERALDEGPQWFSPQLVEFPRGVVNEYPDDLSGVPDPLDLLAVTDPDGQGWLTLLSFPGWKQQHPPEILALRPPTRDSWMQLHAYLVPSEDAEALFAWAQDRDWYGRWMPDSADVANALLGAHPHAPEWKWASGVIEDWNSHSGGEQPAELLQCGAWYGGTGTDRDSSADEETRAFVPSRRLFEILHLTSGVDFVWRDDLGVAIFDPAASSGGPNALLLRRDLLPTIRDAGYELFWTVLVGHEHSASDHGIPGGDYRWITASASYRLAEDRIELVHSLAGQFAVGPRKVSKIDWPTRRREG
ncbi:hypothetical protein [Microbacterium sp. PM5]|uniref:NACHT domain-containing protein n=1 Tax=Microbacterium sp. PM5 TaxID=2014534 RepID=UPI0013AF744A|nr:hypothetical protein [Microbacterium sp. PM5]